MLNKIKPFNRARLGMKIFVCAFISILFPTAAVVIALATQYGKTSGGLQTTTLIIMGVLTLLGILLVVYFSIFLGKYLGSTEKPKYLYRTRV